MHTATDTITIPQEGSGVARWLFEDANGPIDFTGHSGARLQVRAKREQGSTFILEVDSDGGYLTLGADGVIEVTFIPPLISGILPDTYYWDLRLVDGSSMVDYPIGGPFVISPTVTSPLPEPVLP